MVAKKNFEFYVSLLQMFENKWQNKEDKIKISWGILVKLKK